MDCCDRPTVKPTDLNIRLTVNVRQQAKQGVLYWCWSPHHLKQKRQQTSVVVASGPGSCCWDLLRCHLRHGFGGGTPSCGAQCHSKAVTREPEPLVHLDPLEPNAQQAEDAEQSAAEAERQPGRLIVDVDGRHNYSLVHDLSFLSCISHSVSYLEQQS